MFSLMLSFNSIVTLVLLVPLSSSFTTSPFFAARKYVNEDQEQFQCAHYPEDEKSALTVFTRARKSTHNAVSPRGQRTIGAVSVLNFLKLNIILITESARAVQVRGNVLCRVASAR
jgi:hypothetical protein